MTDIKAARPSPLQAPPPPYEDVEPQQEALQAQRLPQYSIIGVRDDVILPKRSGSLARRNCEALCCIVGIIAVVLTICVILFMVLMAWASTWKF
ncbi:MAG: hypothetical protein M1812_008313 [Candelaria pacifica]|nr:MAG: hypothetical protein M1812_008313 [Candelaria pacifica]